MRPLRTDANNVSVSWPPIPRRRFGVPIGGPFDTYAFRTALALLGQEEGEGLEVGFFGGEWEAEEDLVVAHVGPPRADSFESFALFNVAQGERIALGPPEIGHRSYLVWASQAPVTAIRLSTPSESSLEGLHSKARPWVAHSQGSIRFIPASDIRLEGREFTVTPNINRIGLRLALVPEFAHDIELPSEPQCPGAIQITRDGTPIIIGPDGPTIGGYPKAGVVISADMGRLAQMRPGDTLTFAPVSLLEAREAAREVESAWQRSLAVIRVALRVMTP